MKLQNYLFEDDFWGYDLPDEEELWERRKLFLAAKLGHESSRAYFPG